MSMWELARPNRSVLDNSLGGGFDVADDSRSTGSGRVTSYEGGGFLNQAARGLFAQVLSMLLRRETFLTLRNKQ